MIYETRRSKLWIRNARRAGFRSLIHRRCSNGRCQNWLRSRIYRRCKKCRDNQRAFKWRHRIVPAHKREFVVEVDQIITLRMKTILAEEVYLKLATKRIDHAGQRCEYCGIRPHALYRIKVARGFRTLCNGHAEALRRALRTRAERRLLRQIVVTPEEFARIAAQNARKLVLERLEEGRLAHDRAAAVFLERFKRGLGVPARTARLLEAL